MPRKLLTLCHYLSSSARLFLDTYQQRVLRPVSQGLAFLADLATSADSVGFVETAVEHVGFFFVAKKGGGQRFIIDATGIF